MKKIWLITLIIFSLQFVYGQEEAAAVDSSKTEIDNSEAVVDSAKTEALETTQEESVQEETTQEETTDSLQTEAVDSAKVITEKSYEDKYGNIFYKKKVEPHFSMFRWVTKKKAPVFLEPHRGSEPIMLVDVKEYLEVVDGKIGLKYTKVRVYDRERGYIEGFVKNSTLFPKNYYGEPYEFTEEEIIRLKELEEKKRRLKEEAERKHAEYMKQQKLQQVIKKCREDVALTVGMKKKDLDKYMLIKYKEDKEYFANALESVKYYKENTAVYFTFKEQKVVGLLIINTTEGLSEEQANIEMYELVGEIYYTVDDVVAINDFINKKTGKMEKTGTEVKVKTDDSKSGPFIEITIGEFSGIE